MRRLALITGLIILLASCTDDRLFEQNTFIPHQRLEAREKIPFTFEIQDTTALYDIFTNIRITAAYPYSNVFLLVTATNPEGKVFKELVEFTLADVNGKWLGRGLGDIYDYRLLANRFKQMELKKPGTYRFEFEQMMRIKELNGLAALGIRVVKH